MLSVMWKVKMLGFLIWCKIFGDDFGFLGYLSSFDWQF